MNQKFIKNVLIGSAMLGSVVLNSVSVNAEPLINDTNILDKSMSTSQFQEVLATTKKQQLATKFGLPDQIKSLKNTSGEMVGVVWVYHDKVVSTSGKQDALLMIIDGEMKYITLSDAS